MTTEQYYNQNAQAAHQVFAHLDIQHAYSLFLPHKENA
jgi:hypothetical protein